MSNNQAEEEDEWAKAEITLGSLTIVILFILTFYEFLIKDDNKQTKPKSTVPITIMRTQTQPPVNNNIFL